MVPVPWNISFVGEFLPFPLRRRRPNSFVFTYYQRLTLGPCSNFLTYYCLPYSGVVDRAAIWLVHFSWKDAWAR